MPIESDVSVSRVISVHDEPRPVVVQMPNMVPGTYAIPGVNAPQHQFDRCVFSFPGTKKPLHYASIKSAYGQKYVEILVMDGKTFQVSAEQQIRDEYGAKLVPDIMRVAVPVFSAQIANELERQCTNTEDDGSAWGYGVVAIKGETPTEAEIALAKERQIARLRNLVSETNRWAKVTVRNIGEAARQAARTLYAEGLIAELPDWALASIQLSRRCPACNVMYAGEPVKCNNCSAILNWRKAVEYGLIKPQDVPDAKRVEAGVSA